MSASAEKPPKWATFLTYFLLLGGGLLAYRSCKAPAVETASEPVKVDAPEAGAPEPPPTPVVEPEKPKMRKGFKLSAASLLAAYEANEVAADETLGSGKDFEVTHVQAVFPASAAKQLAGLRKGQTLTVQCDCAGKVINVIGRDCGLK